MCHDRATHPARKVAQEARARDSCTVHPPTHPPGCEHHVVRRELRTSRPLGAGTRPTGPSLPRPRALARSGSAGSGGRSPAEQPIARNSRRTSIGLPSEWKPRSGGQGRAFPGEPCATRLRGSPHHSTVSPTPTVAGTAARGPVPIARVRLSRMEDIEVEVPQATAVRGGDRISRRTSVDVVR